MSISDSERSAAEQNGYQASAILFHSGKGRHRVRSVARRSPPTVTTTSWTPLVATGSATRCWMQTTHIA